MGMEVLEVNAPGELIMWLHLAESEVRMGQDGAGIILDYMAEHNMALAVHNQELTVMDKGGEHPEYKPCSIDDVIHDVCEWNLELIDEMEDGMKNPGSQTEYNQFSDARDILKQQEEVLDGLYRQTKYEQIAVECALEIITATLGSVPEGVQEKLEAYRKDGASRQKSEGQRENPGAWPDSRQDGQAAVQQERVR